jgi:hypothetical protein
MQSHAVLPSQPGMLTHTGLHLAPLLPSRRFCLTLRTTIFVCSCRSTYSALQAHSTRRAVSFTHAHSSHLSTHAHHKRHIISKKTPHSLSMLTTRRAYLAWSKDCHGWRWLHGHLGGGTASAEASTLVIGFARITRPVPRATAGTIACKSHTHTHTHTHTHKENSTETPTEGKQQLRGNGR